MRMNTIEQRLLECDEEIQRNKSRKDKVLSCKEKLDYTLNNLRTQLAELEASCTQEDENEENPMADLTQASLVIDSQNEDQSQRSNAVRYPKPEFQEIPPTEKLQKEVVEIERMIRIHTQNADQPVTIQDLEIMEAEHKEYKKQYYKQKRTFERYKNLTEIYSQRINDEKTNLPKKLAHNFQTQMGMRNYKGDLKVDHEDGVINIRVGTHKDAIAAMEMDEDSEKENQTATQSKQRRQQVQDLKGLSGGERSYTTSCFIMSLWECVPAIFRCLDEFDVFMDMLNRRIIMEMLVEMAVNHKENQFFFFTPQGISELQDRDNIQIFTLPKVRDLIRQPTQAIENES